MAVTQTTNGASTTIPNGIAKPTQPAELDVRPHAPWAKSEAIADFLCLPLYSGI